MAVLKQGQEEREEGRREEARERRWREQDELLQELRVILPGVQVLFAFLLTVPFSARFVEISDLDRYAFFFTLLCVAAATGFLTAPTAHHRILWRRSLEEGRLKQGNRYAIMGLVLLFLGMTGAVFTIADVVMGSTVGSLLLAAGFVFFAYVWFGSPVIHGLRNGGFSRKEPKPPEERY